MLQNLSSIKDYRKMNQWIKLLSPRSFSEYTPEEYKEYIRSLYFKKTKKTPTIRLKKKKPTFVLKLTKTGKVSLKVNRDPVFITRAEIAQLAQEHKIEERLIWLKVTDKKKPIRVSDGAEMKGE